MKLAVVLVSPKTSGNVGAAARAMLNMGADDLRIVAPRCDYRDSGSRAMAVHAAKLLEEARVYATLAEAIADRDLVVGTSARLRAVLSAPQHPAGLRPLVRDSAAPALVFGPEESGLSNADLELCRLTMQIPTAEYASLNLAQAVLLSCYEFLQSAASQGAGSEATSANLAASQGQPEAAPPERQAAISSEMEGLYAHLRDVMLLTGYTDAVRARHTLRLWRVALDKATFSPSEVRLVRGLLRQVQWKVAQTGTETQVNTETQTGTDKGEVGSGE
ncbi:RNA methyltransferase [Deinococcus sp.]|uniref:RNA methyltransferase n=1 Tax=Deinococcus sp. TaxID=47478 RepID=UPI0025EE779C|nr:RNA methyltransferase [Deinococcus sp.]